MADLSLYPHAELDHYSARAVPNSSDSSPWGSGTVLHLEALTPAGPRRRCHPHFVVGGPFETGISDLLIKLDDPQLQGPAAHWDGICRECRKTLGLLDLLRARQARIDAELCRHGAASCAVCGIGRYAAIKELALYDTPIEGWQVLPFGQPVTIGAEQTISIVGRPQKVMRGPYRFALHVEPARDNSPSGCGDVKERIYITEIQVGQCTLPIAWGTIWGWAFQDIDPSKPFCDRMLPLAGPPMDLGQQITVGVRNANNVAVTVSVVLFGHGLEERRDRGRAHGVPRASAVARRAREADPGRPLHSSGIVSVPQLPEWSKHALGLDRAEFDDGDPFALGLDRAEFDDGDPSDLERIDFEFAAEHAQSWGAVYEPNVSSIPIRKERSPLEVLLALDTEQFVLDLVPGTARTYEPKRDELRSLVKAAAIIRELGRFWAPCGAAPDPALFVPPRFELAGVEFEVRRYEPPRPAAPPPPSEAELRALGDHASTALYLLEQQRRREETEAEETAWESASDEWP